MNNNNNSGHYFEGHTIKILINNINTILAERFVNSNNNRTFFESVLFILGNFGLYIILQMVKKTIRYKIFKFLVKTELKILYNNRKMSICHLFRCISDNELINIFDDIKKNNIDYIDDKNILKYLINFYYLKFTFDDLNLNKNNNTYLGSYGIDLFVFFINYRPQLSTLYISANQYILLHRQINNNNINNNNNNINNNNNNNNKIYCIKEVKRTDGKCYIDKYYNDGTMHTIIRYNDIDAASVIINELENDYDNEIEYDNSSKLNLKHICPSDNNSYFDHRYDSYYNITEETIF